MSKKDQIIIVRESRHGNRMLQVSRELWESKERNANRGLRKAWDGFRELKDGEEIKIKTTTGIIKLKQKQKNKKATNTEEINND